MTLWPLKNYPLQVVNVTGAVKTPGNRLWNGDCLVETRKSRAVFCAHVCQGVNEAELGKGGCDKAEAEPLGISEAGMALQSCPESRRRAKLLNPCRLSPRRGVTLWAMPMEGDSWGGTQLWSVSTPHSQQLQGWGLHPWEGIWAGTMASTAVMKQGLELGYCDPYACVMIFSSATQWLLLFPFCWGRYRVSEISWMPKSHAKRL